MEGTDDVVARWRELAHGALKGAPYETLTSTTADGIVLEPLHGPSPPHYSGRPTAGRWQVVQRIDADEGGAAQAIADLTNGADALELVFAGAPLAYGRGLTATTLDDLDAVLAEVLIEHAPIHLAAGGLGYGALSLFAALAERRGVAPAALHAGVDPCGALFACGSARLADAGDAIAAFVERGFNGTALLADGRPAAEAGATPAQELAFALASFLAHLRAADEAGVSPERAFPLIAMGLCADQDQFATIAKLRAARRLHGLIASQCRVEASLALHASTSWRMLSRSDPHTNLLRLTIAALSAGCGGVDALTVLPFDDCGPAGASPFARRMGRNIQSLLLEEAHVAALADPGAGSGTIETLTDALAQAAWSAFQAIDGHHVERIADGTWADEIARSERAAQREVADGERAIIGVTRHPPAEPRRVAPQPAIAAPKGSEPSHAGTFEERVRGAAQGASIGSLSGEPSYEAPASPPIRLSAPHEG